MEGSRGRLTLTTYMQPTVHREHQKHMAQNFTELA